MTFNPYARSSKYNAKRTAYNGRSYDSKAEAARASQLDLLQRAGEIVWWIPQVKIPLGPDDSLKVDFLVGADTSVRFPGYPEMTPIMVHAEDVKGVETADFRRKMKLWRKYGLMPLHVIKGKKVEIVRKEREQ